MNVQVSRVLQKIAIYGENNVQKKESNLNFLNKIFYFGNVVKDSIAKTNVRKL